MAKIGRQVRRRFQELLAANPSFQCLLDDGKSWLCPYCGKVALSDRQAPTFEDLALHHLLTTCPTARGLEGAPLPLARLQELVQLDRLRRRFIADAAWRVRIGDGAWLCPYCIQATKTRLVNKNGERLPVETVIRGMRSHLQTCYQYRQSPDKWHGTKEIQALLQKKSAAEEVAQVVGSDPVFQFTDRFGRWICPFCEKPIEGIDFSTPFARAYTAPPLVLAHFRGGSCQSAGQWEKPGKSVADMQAVADRFAATADKGQPPAAPGDTQYIDLLKSELGELKEHLEHSKELQRNLQRARKAQRRMLPAEPPQIAGYDIAAYFKASEEVSGDFYDFVAVPDNRLGILIGDVSGHGIDAGLVMGMAKKAFGVRAQSGAGPEEVAARVNEDIFPEVEKTTFVTATYGILDPQYHAFQFVRCGHTFPVFYHAVRQRVEEVQSEGLVLGSIPGELFSRKTRPEIVQMSPGDCLVLFTDGLSEAMAEDGAEFGLEQIKEVIGRHTASTALGIVEGLVGALQMFTYGQPQSDDQTILVVKRLP